MEITKGGVGDAAKEDTQVEKELGSKPLAYVSRITRGLIRVIGVDAARKRVISGIEGDLKRDIKKNPSTTVDDLIKDALRTPDYMALLKDFGMGEEHLRLSANEARQKWGDKNE